MNSTLKRVVRRARSTCALALIGPAVSVPLFVIGASKLRNLRGRGFVLFAAIVALLPFTLVFPINFLIGIWVLWVLARPEVQAAFARNAPPPKPPEQEVAVPTIGLILAGFLQFVGIFSGGFGFLQFLDRWLHVSGALFVSWILLCAFCAAFGVIGALRMKRLRSYDFALFSTFLFMIPLSFTWLLGLPMAIWALVLLSKPEIRAAFDRKETQTSSPATTGQAGESIGAQWEMWWFNRDAFTRNAIKTVLYLIGFGGMILFLSFTHRYQMVEGTETTVIKIGAYDPWFVYDVTKGRGGQFGIYFSWSLLFGVLAAVFLFALLKIESSEIRRRREQALARTPEQQGVGPAPTQSSAARSRLWKILGPLLVMLALVTLAPIFLPLLAYLGAVVVGVGSYLFLLLPESGREILLYAMGLWLAGLGVWLLWKRRAAAKRRDEESLSQEQGKTSEAAEKQT